jgi:uncharacterized lipoprotein YmbA
MRRRLLMLVLAAGCFTAHPDPTRFYVLTPMPGGEGIAPVSAPAPVVLGLGPITLPRYLERAELIHRVGPNEVQPARFDRWAEPLDRQIARTLAEDLTMLGVVSRVMHHPWYRTRDQDVVLELDVFRFERDAAHHAVLDARWRLRCPGGGEVLRVEDAALVDSAVALDAAATAEALSRQVGELSRQIAAALQARSRSDCADAKAQRDGRRPRAHPVKP